MNSSERNEINRLYLHPPVANWNPTPTAILPPTNHPPKGSNPFSGRIRNNLHSGNPNRRHSLTQNAPIGPAELGKRKRGISNTFSPESRPRVKAGRSHPPLGPDTILDLTTDTEDTGEVLVRPNVVSRSNGDPPIPGIRRDNTLHSKNSRHLILNGDATARIRSKLLDDDPIESFSDDSTAPKFGIEPGAVTSKVDALEARNLDFRSMKSKTVRVNLMKDKLGNSHKTDPLMAQSLSPKHDLCVDAWYFCSELFKADAKQQYWLSVDMNQIFTVQGTSSKEVFLKFDGHKMEYTATVREMNDVFVLRIHSDVHPDFIGSLRGSSHLSEEFDLTFRVNIGRAPNSTSVEILDEFVKRIGKHERARHWKQQWEIGVNNALAIENITYVTERPSSSSSRHVAQLRLLVDEWCLGNEIFTTPYHVVWTSGEDKIVITSKDHREEIHVERVVTKLYYSPNWRTDSKITVALRIENDARGKPIGSNYKNFKPGGARNSGFITLVFSEHNPRTDMETFMQFLIQTVSDGDTDTPEKIWTRAFKAAEMQRQNQIPAQSQNRTREDLDTRNLTARIQTTSRAKRKRQGTVTIDSDSEVETLTATLPLRRSERTQPQVPLVDPEEIILKYPHNAPVTLTNGDLYRLQPGEFLNDTVIEFGLKLWLKDLEARNPELAKDIHIFNSFFYKKLDRKKSNEGYDSVKRWTSKIDIFSKKYLVVPINEHMHWYLCIIYMPEHVLTPTPVVEITSPSTRRQTRKSQKALELDSSQGSVLEIPPPNAMMVDSPNDMLPEPGPVTPTDSSERDADEVDSSMFDIVSNMKAIPGTSTETAETSLENIDVDSEMRQQSSPLSSLDEENEHRMNMDVDMDDEEGEDEDPLLLKRCPVSPTASETGQMLSERDVMGNDDQKRQDNEHVLGVPIATTSFGPPHTPSKETKLKTYGKSQIANGKQKAIDLETTDKVPNILSVPNTSIFTMDSLGSRHIRASNVLSQYLQREAHDKKGVEHPSKAVMKYVQVPAQPNFCDCGIYLLHFARTFIEDTDKFQQYVSNPKTVPQDQKDSFWNIDQLENFREKMSTQIQGLSKEWKLAVEAQKKETADVPENVDSSDDDVDIVEHIVSPSSAARLR